MTRQPRKVPVESDGGFHPLNTLRTELEAEASLMFPET
jgi:hypothetical protein